jgi:flagellar biosynthesis/type III secretory pathway protein FliH
MLAERIDEWNRKLAEENLQKGRQEGLQKGLQKGLLKGRQEGRKEGEAHALLRLLEKKFGALPRGAQKRIAAAELELLSEWFDRAVTAERLEDVFGA